MKRNKTSLRETESALYKAILRLETPEECRAFFKDLCTPAELEALADRWRVAQMLVKNTPYRTISEETGVSVTTVTRVARFLNDGNGGYKIILARGDAK